MKSIKKRIVDATVGRETNSLKSRSNETLQI